MRGIREHFRPYAHALRFAIGLHCRGAKQGGVGGVSTPRLNFGWGGGVERYMSTPPDFEKKILGGGGLAPLKLI